MHGRLVNSRISLLGPGIPKADMSKQGFDVREPIDTSTPHMTCMGRGKSAACLFFLS